MGIFSVINEELFSMDKKPPKLKCNFKYIKVYLNVYEDGYEFWPRSLDVQKNIYCISLYFKINFRTLTLIFLSSLPLAHQPPNKNFAKFPPYGQGTGEVPLGSIH